MKNLRNDVEFTNESLLIECLSTCYLKLLPHFTIWCTYDMFLNSIEFQLLLDL